MSTSCILLQFGDNPFYYRVEDLESRAAFNVSQVSENPNIVLQLNRENEWAQQHPSIMGPNRSFFYFGPGKSPGRLAYGNSPTQPMANSMRRKRDSSISRYFTPQNGSKEYKWKITAHRMECFDGRTCIALWEISSPNDDFYARLTLRPAALPIVTEIFTTLTLNRIALALEW